MEPDNGKIVLGCGYTFLALLAVGLVAMILILLP